MSARQKIALRWASIIGTVIGAAVVGAGTTRVQEVPAARDAPAVVTQAQWAQVTTELRALNERTARIENILMEGRRQ